MVATGREMVDSGTKGSLELGGIDWANFGVNAGQERDRSALQKVKRWSVCAAPTGTWVRLHALPNLVCMAGVESKSESQMAS